MKKITLALSLISALIILTAFSPINERKAHIHKIVVKVAKELRATVVKSNFDGQQVSDDKETELEKFSGIEVGKILSGFSNIIRDGGEYEQVNYEPADNGAGAKMAKGMKALGKGAITGQNETTHNTNIKMDYFPNVSIKKLNQVTANELLEVQLSINWGGNASNVVAMDKVTKPGFTKFNVDVKIIARNANGDVIWEKKQIVSDFSSVFPEDQLPSNSNKFFKLKRTGDNQFLSKNEMRLILNHALEVTI